MQILKCIRQKLRGALIFQKIIIKKKYVCFRAEKEKARFQQEVYDLLAQVESATKDKVQ